MDRETGAQEFEVASMYAYRNVMANAQRDGDREMQTGTLKGGLLEVEYVSKSREEESGQPDAIGLRPSTQEVILGVPLGRREGMALGGRHGRKNG